MGVSSEFHLPSVGILAGGAGTRFGGADKPWVKLKGRGLVEWTLDGARPQSSELLVSANRHLERYAALGLKAIADDSGEAHAGPMAGLVQLLEAASQPWMMCLPCDLVQVPAGLAHRFHLRATEENADIVVLADDSGIHPTICYLRCRLAADARACFDAGERAPRRWFNRHKLARLRSDPPLNVNSPERLVELAARLESGA